MPFQFIKNLEGKELTDEKIRDFKRLLISQIAIIASIFFLEFSESAQLPLHPELPETIFFTVLGIYVFLLWDALRNYTRNKLIILVNFVFIIGVFVLGTVVANPFIELIDRSSLTYKVLLLFTQISLLTVEGCLIYFTVIEFLKKDFDLSIKLWAAACIYLMTGLAFGSFYEMFCIFDVDCLGMDFPLRTMALMKRMGYSMMVLSGMNIPYTPTGTIYMASTFEALWGQLFVVLIVGRLMIK
ncbi:MAG TPA: hypothetical protein VL728_07060 [Cyclobacteriaceae bacterium]|jgi:hypothetical protein|nr:hypothetical protein [Cyclobacteriaceae bacterium]